MRWLPGGTRVERPMALSHWRWSIRRPASSVSASTMYDVNVHVGNHTFWVAAWVKNTMAMGLPAMKYTWSQPLAFRRAAAVLACRWAVDTSSWYTTMSLKCRPYLAILFTMIFS